MGQLLIGRHGTMASVSSGVMPVAEWRLLVSGGSPGAVAWVGSIDVPALLALSHWDNGLVDLDLRDEAGAVVWGGHAVARTCRLLDDGAARVTCEGLDVEAIAD